MRYLKHLMTAFFGVILVGALTGPAPAQQCEYNVALDATFAPHAMAKMGGGLEGYNVDMANELGRRLGCKMKITGAEWSGLLPAMMAGKYDFIVAPTTVTMERSKNMLFVEGYFDADWQFLARKDGPDFKGLNDLKGKIVAVNKGNVYDQWARERAGTYGWKVESYGTQADAVQAVIAGRVDVTLTSNSSVGWAVKMNPQVKPSFVLAQGKVFSIPFPKDAVALRNKIEDVVECMKIDGYYARLYEKWFGAPPKPRSVSTAAFLGYGDPSVEGYDPTPHKLNCN